MIIAVASFKDRAGSEGRQESEEGKRPMSRRIRKPSVIDYPELQAQKARLGLTHKDLVNAAGCSCRTVTAFVNGDETLRLQTIIQLAGQLGLRVKVTFEPVEKEVEEQQPLLQVVT